ncbi:MAG: peptide deformylase [Deltaproteobacteria bacterium]|nr:peptide deformylase [Deltaproteobacteria bacterium]
MAVRQILHYPDKRLRIPCKPVTAFDDELRSLVEDLIETMYHGRGVGLAAPQIGVSKRLFVVDVANNEEDAPSEIRVFINPQIIEREGRVVWNEGCLSFPGIHEDIERAERIKAAAYDAAGERFELEADGLLAVAIQHESDHLDGTLIIDHISMLRRRLVNRTMKRQEKQSAKSA